MKVSIIIPVYHVEKYIERCVMSVLKQDYRPLEVVFVDDFSNDKSLDYAKRTISEYGESQIEFQFIKQSENRGQGIARNTGIESSTGDFLYFLDSDDQLCQNAISVMAAQLAQFPQSEIVHGKMIYDDGREIIKKTQDYLDGNHCIRNNHYSPQDVFLDSACDKLIKKKFIVSNDLFFKGGIIFEDTHWLERAIKKLQYISFVSAPTYIRFINPNSTMTSLTKEREIINVGSILKDFVLSLDEPCYDAQLFTYFKKFILYYGASRGKYGYNELYVKFEKEFFKRKFCKMALYLLLYKCPFLPENKVKARLRGYMYKTINAFFDQK